MVIFLHNVNSKNFRFKDGVKEIERELILYLLPVSLVLEQVADSLLLLGADELDGEAWGGEGVARVGVHLKGFLQEVVLLSEKFSCCHFRSQRITDLLKFVPCESP